MATKRPSKHPTKPERRSRSRRPESVKRTPARPKRELRSRRTGRTRRLEPKLDFNDPELGVVQIIEALEGVRFPIDSSELLETAGDRRVSFRQGESVAIRDLIEDLDDEGYPDLGSLVGAVSSRLRRKLHGVPAGA